MTGHQPSAPVVYSFSNPEELIESLAHFIIKAQKESIQKKGRFTVAVSGGSLPKQLNGLIGKDGVKWDKWQVHLLDLLLTPYVKSSPTMVMIVSPQASVLRRRAYRTS